MAMFKAGKVFHIALLMLMFVMVMLMMMMMLLLVLMMITLLYIFCCRMMWTAFGSKLGLVMRCKRCLQGAHEIGKLIHLFVTRCVLGIAKVANRVLDVKRR